MTKIDLQEKKYLIFDFDETISTLLMDWTIWKKGMSDLTNNYVKNTDFLAYDHLFILQNTYIEKFGQEINREFIDFAKRFERDLFEGHNPDMVVVDYIKANKLHKIFIWTSNHTETVQPLLVELGISEKIVSMIARDTVEFVKPNPIGFSDIYIPETEKREYLMIGDSSSDEGAAINAGIDFIHVDNFKKLVA